MYANYKHLIGKPYKAGADDCFGMARQYYIDLFDLMIPDVARPETWWYDKELNLITDCILLGEWEDVGLNLRNLKVGDALIFSLISSRANHIGVYVGNGLFIHHLYQRMSCEEALVSKWMSRCLMVVRHKKVTEKQKQETKTVDIRELLKNAK